jgi:hypothetical protein
MRDYLFALLGLDGLGQDRSFDHVGNRTQDPPDSVVLSRRTTVSQVLCFSYTSWVRRNERKIYHENGGGTDLTEGRLHLVQVPTLESAEQSVEGRGNNPLGIIGNSSRI